MDYYCRIDRLLIGILMSVALIYSCNVSAVTTYTYNSFDLPDQTYWISGINDSGQIVGYYTTGGRTRVFIRSNSGVYTTLNDPPPDVGNVWDIWAEDINNSGEIVGGYLSGETGNRGFTYSNGSYRAIVAPGPNVSIDYALGISNKGDMVGTSDNIYRGGFIESGGNYTPLNDPIDPATPGYESITPSDINSSGQVLGNYGGSGLSGAFIRGTDGVYTFLPTMYFGPQFGNVPPTTLAMNDSGQAVVYFNGGCTSYVWSGNEYTQIIHPLYYQQGGSINTCARSINDKGQVVGEYSEGGLWRGFIATPVSPLSALISTKSGTQNARFWTITLTNSGTSLAKNAQIDGISLVQTYGAACTPIITSPLSPLAVGDIPSHSSASGQVTLNFTGCAAAARFTVSIQYRSNSGAVTGSKTLYNQFR